MRSSKIFYFISRLPISERKKFLLFLQSPFFNHKKEPETLFQILEQLLVGKGKSELSEEAAWKLVFRKLPFDKNRFRKLKAELLRLLISFLEIRDFQNDPQNRQFRFLRQLNAMQENRYFGAYARLPEGEEGPQGWQKMEFMLERYRFEARQPRRSPVNTLGEALAGLEAGYQQYKLRLAYLVRNQKTITGDGELPEGMAELLEKLHGNWENVGAASKLYALLFEGAESGRLDCFSEVLQILQAPDTRLPQQVREEGFAGSMNFCVQQINQGKQEFMPLVWKLYQQGISSGELLEQGKLLAAHCKNIVAVSVALGEIAWAESFLHDFRERLYGDFQENAVRYNQGVLQYHAGAYTEAERNFNAILPAFEDSFYGLDSRAYLLRIFYDTEDVVRFVALSDAFRMYLKRLKKMPAARKKAYALFVRFLNRLMLVAAHDTAKLDKLEADIRGGRRMGATPWLLKKLAAKQQGASAKRLPG